MVYTSRLAALDALLKVERDAGYSNIVIDQVIKKSGLSSKESSLATAIFYGVLERKLTLDYIVSQYSKLSLKNLSSEVLIILRMAIYQLLYMDKIPASAAVNESVNLVKLKRIYKAVKFVNGILRTFLRNNKRFEMPSNEIDYLSIKYSCSKWIIDSLFESYGKEVATELLKTSFLRPSINIRVNTLKTTAKNLKNLLEEEGILSENLNLGDDALTLKSTGQLSSLKCYNKGLFHVQDIASQICCKILAAQPGETIIDVCAAPGGKTFTIAEMMQNQGRIFAFDKFDSKINLILAGAKRLGISIVNATKRDAQFSNEKFEKADKVLCDVPCSGFGVMRRKPEIKYKNSYLMDELPNIQYAILCKSAELVKQGGILIYSTCTLNLKENNYIANEFLKNHKNEFVGHTIDCEGLNLKKNSFDAKNQLTLMPHIHNTDGFFVAAFKKVK